MRFIRAGRHNMEPAKTRALTSKRVARHRLRSERYTPVTPVALPEKRREEKSSKKKQAKKKFAPPTVEEVAAYCRERGNSIDPETFVNHYEANGWVRGKSPIKDWRACVRTWEKNQRSGTDGYRQQQLGDF